MTDRLFVGNDNLIQWLGAVNEATGDYLNLAVCHFTVYTEAGLVVPGAQNVSMSHVPDSNGDYVGTLESSVALVADRLYTVEITLAQGNLVGLFRRKAVAVDRD